ncbi:response regulator transcription factor [Gracilibacillus kekensis]|uniref:Two component transcriptional regulator, AraC family n=1 Tax=Gracilibacillus kekensis TaxID=1027249 RepID=A0A1M7L8W4_9BACI|nr:response regulator [Gracilibacillus kekensis]SHM74493.1 two component transcriptional regulator, AraC family [Gracilibacillus kekensis]
MTLKMLIVDDEPLICQGLMNTIPWNEMEIDVVGSAINGKKALEIMETEPVDIVITDVYMPEMDGIQLSKAIIEHFPDVTIIMISGYEEFEYARQALRIGVEDYLLKPVDIDELWALVGKVKQQIEETRRQQQSKNETILSNYLSQQLFHLPDSYHLSEKIKHQHYAFRLLLIEKRNYYKTNQSALSYDKLKQMMDQMNVSSIGVEMHENQLVLFLYDQEGIFTEKIDQLTAMIQKYFNGDVSLAISSCYHDMHQLATLYQKLNTRLSYYRGTSKQVVTDDENLPSVNNYNYNRQQAADLAEAVFQQNNSAVRNIVANLFHRFEDKSLTLQQIKRQCLFLIASVKERAQESMFEQIDFRLSEDTDLLIYNSVCALQDLLEADLNSMLEYVERSNDSHWIIQQAKQYIEKNYQQDIKALEVAEAHYITPNYFSMLFKQETGQNYSEYLNTIRINKAKELLSDTSNKVFEIAEYVGYREYKYFVQVFKNYVGITPTQFRKLHSIEK